MMNDVLIKAQSPNTSCSRSYYVDR